MLAVYSLKVSVNIKNAAVPQPILFYFDIQSPFQENVVFGIAKRFSVANRHTIYINISVINDVKFGFPLTKNISTIINAAKE